MLVPELPVPVDDVPEDDVLVLLDVAELLEPLLLNEVVEVCEDPPR